MAKSESALGSASPRSSGPNSQLPDSTARKTRLTEYSAKLDTAKNRRDDLLKERKHRRTKTALFTQQKQDGRYVPVERILEPQPNRSRTRQEMRALRALRLMSAHDRDLLEDRLIESVTLEQLSLEHGCDPRTIAKRVSRVIERLHQAESDLP
jgi:hypothetical protein